MEMGRRSLSATLRAVTMQAMDTTRFEAARSALVDALWQLPQRQRACWLLTQVEGLSQAEAAQALRMTPDAVRGQLARARQSLTTMLEDWR